MRGFHIQIDTGTGYIFQFLCQLGRRLPTVIFIGLAKESSKRTKNAGQKNADTQDPDVGKWVSAILYSFVMYPVGCR
jgi:hypothetical protein